MYYAYHMHVDWPSGCVTQKKTTGSERASHRLVGEWPRAHLGVWRWNALSGKDVSGDKVVAMPNEDGVDD